MQVNGSCQIGRSIKIRFASYVRSLHYPMPFDRNESTLTRIRLKLKLVMTHSAADDDGLEAQTIIVTTTKSGAREL